MGKSSNHLAKGWIQSCRTDAESNQNKFLSQIVLLRFWRLRNCVAAWWFKIQNFCHFHQTLINSHVCCSNASKHSIHMDPNALSILTWSPLICKQIPAQNKQHKILLQMVSNSWSIWWLHHQMQKESFFTGDSSPLNHLTTLTPLCEGIDSNYQDNEVYILIDALELWSHKIW